MASHKQELTDSKRSLLKKYIGEKHPATTKTESLEQHSAPLLSADPHVPVVPIQVGGSQRPFFYLHVHVIGGAFYNFALARHLGADQPFYMLDPYILDTQQLPPTLEEMAAAYITSLRSVQPEGPYQLAGFCGGGMIAFEMAQQLRAQGQVVELLALIEPRDGPAPHRLFVRKAFCGLFRRIGPFIGLNPKKQLEWFLRLRYIGLYLAQSQYRIDKQFQFYPTTEELLRDWIGIFVWIISQYHTRRYPGKVIYLWAEEEPRYLRTWWGKISEAQELEVHLLPGSHETCRTEHLESLAACLQRCLSEAKVFPLEQ
jgi:thioesterase domain-containing protein